MVRLEERPVYSQILVTARKRAKLTQAQLAQMAQIPIQTLRRYEQGIKAPKITTMALILSPCLEDRYSPEFILKIFEMLIEELQKRS